MSEQQQYETVWSGARWRESQVTAASVCDLQKPCVRVSRQWVNGGPNEHRLWSVLGDSWTPVGAWAKAAGITLGSHAYKAINSMLASGKVERRPVVSGRQGRPAYLYRRVRPEAA